MGQNINTRLKKYFNLLPRRILARFLIDHLVRHGLVPARGKLRDVYGYALQLRILKVSKNHALHELFLERDPNPFALSDTTLVWLWAYLCKTEPECIVEMGSGRSTVVFALYAKKQVQDGKSKPVVISIDSEEKWLAATMEKLNKFDLTGFVNFMHCRLINNTGTNIDKHGYVIDYEKLDTLLDNKKINLLLIDGPSGGQGREATLPYLAERLEIDTNVFLDDASRCAEQTTINKWLGIFNDHLFLRGILPLGKGLAWMQVMEKLQYKKEVINS